MGLGWLNPFRPFIEARERRELAVERQRELDRLERAEDRELLRQTIESMSRMVGDAMEAVKVQGDAHARWIASFDTPTAPQIREWDEDADTSRYMERRGGQQPRPPVQQTIPDELIGLDRIKQFELLLDRMGS